MLSLELYSEAPTPFWWVQYTIVKCVPLDLQNSEIWFPVSHNAKLISPAASAEIKIQV